MIRISNVFSDGALFQSGSKLTVAGLCSAKTINIRIDGENAVFFSGSVSVKADSSFELAFLTPEASFQKYTLVLSTDAEEKRINNILFGEVWLASGQSNMEMPNFSQTYKQDIFDKVRGKNIRLYHALYHHKDNSGDFPWEPDRFAPGYWVLSDDDEKLNANSAIGLKFALDVYDRLNVNLNVPVGIFDASWGGTSMRSWLPMDAVMADEKVSDRMKAVGHFPSREDWNRKGEGNYQQLSAQYNIKIAPLEGAKVRGIIWYQGETDIGLEYKERLYSYYLRLYHRVYSQRFAADPNSFFMISSLIYPGWTYGSSGECGVGYVNRAFVETAMCEPNKFIAVPNYDLKPSWAYHQENHPIHPTHKYELAQRMARAALVNAYGIKADQSGSAYMESFEIKDNKLLIKFANASNGLEIRGKNVRSLYAAGDDGVYLPACAKTLGDVLEVWCDEVKDIKHAAYAVQSMEPFGNIFCGEYPVQPFFTDDVNEINIQSRPWYDMENTSFWASRVGEKDHDKDVFYRPVWLAGKDSFVCRDDAFTLDGYSLRVEGEGDQFSCFVRSFPYNELDLNKFRAISLNLYSFGTVSVKLRLITKRGDIILPFKEKQEILDNWRLFEAELCSIDRDLTVTQMHFEFENCSGPYRSVNIEHIRLHK